MGASQVASNAPSEAYAHPLYVAHACHHRTIAYQSTTPFESDFEIQTPYVRVVLPQSLTPDKNEILISTAVGEVRLKGDHMVGSVDLVAEKYSDAAHLGYKPKRVELITTPRYGGTRYAGAWLGTAGPGSRPARYGSAAAGDFARARSGRAGGRVTTAVIQAEPNGSARMRGPMTGSARAGTRFSQRFGFSD